MLLTWPAAPVAMTGTLLLGKEGWEGIQKGFYDSGIIGQELVNPSIPVITLLIIYYVHRYVEDRPNKNVLLGFLYLLAGYQFIMNIKCEYMTDVRNFCMRIDIPFIGILLWIIMLYIWIY